jgi:uncharacterized protein YktA (UPF0223 family)
MAQTRSGNWGRGRGRGRISGGRGGGRTSEDNWRTASTTPAIDANTGTCTPQRNTTIPRKNRGPVTTLQQTAEPVTTFQPTETAGPVITSQLTAGPVAIIHPGDPSYQPAGTMLQHPTCQGSHHGSMPGLFPSTPSSRITGQAPIVTTGNINQLLQEENAKDLFMAILIEIEIKPYMEIWTELGIYNLETMNDFINRPSTMYNAILHDLFKVSPSFPETSYIYLKGEEDIEKLVTDLKYFKEFVQKKCQCSLMEMAYRETDITVYQSYKDMTPGKRQIWLEQLRKNANSSDELSRYSSVQNILDKQDEMVTMVRNRLP